MTTVENDGDMMTLGSGDQRQDGVKFPVADIRDSVTIRVKGITIDGTKCFDVPGASGTDFMIVWNFDIVEIRTVIRGAVSSVVNDDIIAFLDVGIVDETEKCARDISAGRVYRFGYLRGSMLLGSQKKLDAQLRYVKFGSQVLLK